HGHAGRLRRRPLVRLLRLVVREPGRRADRRPRPGPRLRRRDHRLGPFDRPADADARPGELILFGTEHVGIVKSVNADGSLTTVEGNASDGVREETRWPSEATGYVTL